jgi:hypothetical protein
MVRVGLLIPSGEVGAFEVNDISRCPVVEGTSLDSSCADPNFQPYRVLRLLMRELLYSLQRGKLKMRWLKRRLGYLFLGGTDGNRNTYSPVGCNKKSPINVTLFFRIELILTDARKNIRSNVATSEVINPVCTVTVGFLNFRTMMCTVLDPHVV